MKLCDVNFKEIKPKYGTTSKYFIDDNKKYFMKIPKLYKENNILEREILILKLLNENNFDWCPKLLYYDSESIITEYCGESINYENIPDDFEEQIGKILLDLKSVNVKHNDIWMIGKEPEFLVKNNKIYLIDFGWSSINDDFSCGDINISSEKKPHGIADDSLVIEYLKKMKKKNEIQG